MTRIVTVLTAALALTAAAPTLEPASVRSISNSILKIDISPEEAQQYLNSPPFTSPQLSSKTATLPLVRWDDPRFRSAESGPTNGHYWKNGREIENTQDYDEEATAVILIKTGRAILIVVSSTGVIPRNLITSLSTLSIQPLTILTIQKAVYDAQQFHGQDGLGAYAYGYKAPESSKVENRARSGDVSGAYEFKAGNNDIIKVRYWADSEGFHQEDNVPRDLPKPPEEPEDVRQARLAHEKAWQEAAAAAAQHPDPQGEYNINSQQQYQPYSQYQQSASEQSSVLAAPSPNMFQRERKSYQNYPGPQKLYNQPQDQGNPCSACNSVQPDQTGPQDESRESNPCSLCNGPQLAQTELQQAPSQDDGSQRQVQFGEQITQSSQQQNSFDLQSGPSSQIGSQPGGSSSSIQPAQTGSLQGQSSQQQPQYALPQGQEQQGTSELQERQSRQRNLNGLQNLDQQRAQRQQQPEEPEPTGPPRGFFYSFNYPVSILTRKGGEQDSGPSGFPGQQGQYGNQGQFGNQGRPGGQGLYGSRPSGQQPIDSDTVGVNVQRP